MVYASRPQNGGQFKPTKENLLHVERAIVSRVEVMARIDRSELKKGNIYKASYFNKFMSNASSVNPSRRQPLAELVDVEMMAVVCPHDSDFDGAQDCNTQVCVYMRRT